MHTCLHAFAQSSSVSLHVLIVRLSSCCLTLQVLTPLGEDHLQLLCALVAGMIKEEADFSSVPSPASGWFFLTSSDLR